MNIFLKRQILVFRKLWSALCKRQQLELFAVFQDILQTPQMKANDNRTVVTYTSGWKGGYPSPFSLPLSPLSRPSTSITHLNNRPLFRSIDFNTNLNKYITIYRWHMSLLKHKLILRTRHASDSTQSRVKTAVWRPLIYLI